MRVDHRQQAQPFRIIFCIIEHAYLDAFELVGEIEYPDAQSLLLTFDMVECTDRNAAQTTSSW